MPTPTKFSVMVQLPVSALPNSEKGKTEAEKAKYLDDVCRQAWGVSFSCAVASLVKDAAEAASTASKP